jgi:alanine racemase
LKICYDNYKHQFVFTISEGYNHFMPISTDECTAWLEIDLGAIQNNIRLLRQKLSKPVMAVVKANAFGHGIIPSSKAALAGNAEWLGVARIEEALQLREAGIQAPVLVFGYTAPCKVKDAAGNSIRLTVYDVGIAQAYNEEALRCGAVLKVHVKVDTGMGRLGLFPNQAVNFLQTLAGMKGLEIEGIFTHFARADEPEQQTTQEQINRFTDIIWEIEKMGLRPPWVHADNSAGSLNFPQASHDLIRTGIVVYGLSPSSSRPLPDGYRAALSFKAKLVSIKEFPPGSGISYSHRYVTYKTEKIGVIPVGYADGLRRVSGNEVLIRGVRVPVVGNVCMDQCMIQLEKVPDAQIGDEVVLIGQQNGDKITADDLAELWGTINYEVVCNMAARLPRIYIE